MDREFFWELFHDTGDPICWLLTRGKHRPEKEDKPRERRGKKTAAPG